MIHIRLKFDEIQRDAFGRIETPVLMLKKPHGAILGALGDFYALEMELKFNETSTMKFNYPKRNHGRRTMFYDNVVGDKLIQVDPYGIFIVTEVNENMDERGKIKEVECRSREQELADKRAFFAEGTYNLWNPADVENTLLGMLFADQDWKIGSVSASLIGKYRTFPETDSKLLDVLLGDVQEKYGCVFDFDTYTRTVNVIDIDEPVATMPVFLSRKNLIQSGELREDVSSIFTKVYVQGAEGVDIHNVNPTGENYIYNLDYYISNGDLPSDLAAKWRAWENALFSRQQYYTSVVALRNAVISRLAGMNAELVDLNNELKTLDNTRATFLQMLKTPYSDESMAYLKAHGISTENVDEYFNGRLDDTAKEYSAIEDEITALKAKIAEAVEERDGHIATLAEINSELKLDGYFAEDEMKILRCYFKEDCFSDNTFAVFDVDVESSGTYKKLSSAPLVFTDIKLSEVDCEGGHRISVITGGHVSVAEGDVKIEANIIRGVLDHIDGEVVCSIYIGSGTDNGDNFPSGNLTYTAVATYDDDSLLSGMTKHSDTIYSSDKSVSHTMYYYTGDATIPGANAKVYFTRNVTDYQQYSVEQDLFDYAQDCMEEIAWPGYEFDIESGNFVFAQKFDPFKNSIQLGCNVHLEYDDDLFLKPMLIEIHLNFDESDDFTLVFSNYFQRPDRANGLKDLLDRATSTSRSIDMSKYEFGQNANTTTWVKDMLQQGFDAAKAQISAGKDQMVSITESGIVVDSENGTSKIYLNNGMIALLDKNTNTVKMAMGHFLNEASGADFVGVLADVIGGTLIAGQNLIIECPDPNGGVMQFKVDSSGVILNNGRMYMKTDKGAMGWDANYGFFAGVPGLFETTDTGYVHPVCIDPETDELIFDDKGFPKDVSVWIGIDGKAYFRGNVYAENGYFSGEVHATSGTFKGTVQASDFLNASGESMLVNGKWSSDYLDVRGLNVNNNLIIDENGNVTINGGSISWSAVTGTDEIDQQIQDATDIANEAYDIANSVKLPGYIKSTYIDSTTVRSPTIEGGNIYGANYYGNTFNIFPDSSSGSGSFNIYGNWLSDIERIMTIAYSTPSGAPLIEMYSPLSGELYMSFGRLYFKSGMTIDFSGANVTGLPSTTAVFG